MLTDAQIRACKPGDKDYTTPKEDGLFVLIKTNGSRLWRHAFTFLKKERLCSLGSYPEVSLADARLKAAENRALIAKGVDPIEYRKLKEAQAIGNDDRLFGVLAAEYLVIFGPKWSADTLSKIQGRLENWVLPWLMDRPIDRITHAEVREVLNRCASKTLDTAHRVRYLLSKIFTHAATARAWEKPLHNIILDLKDALPAVSESHFAAITEVDDIGPLMRAIRGYHGTLVTRAAVRLAPLTFVRPTELRHMEWAELSFEDALWAIPGRKMKMGLPFLVPLSRQALTVLEELRPLTGRGGYVFPGARDRARPMSESTVLAALRRMGYSEEEMTGHGFRAMARTVLDEVLGFRPDIIDHQLSHKVKDANGRAYNRTTHLPERRRMMQVWADYLDELEKKAPRQEPAPVP